LENTYACQVPNLGKQTDLSACRAKPYWQRTGNSTSAPPTLVWIDDYEPGLGVYKEMYEELGYRVFTASRGVDGLRILAARAADAVIVDYEMPEMDGGVVAKSIKQRWPSMPVIMFSGCGTVPHCIAEVVDAFCDKAGQREDLLIAIQTVLQKNKTTTPHRRVACSLAKLSCDHSTFSGCEELTFQQENYDEKNHASLCHGTAVRPGNICPNNSYPRSERGNARHAERISLHAAGTWQRHQYERRQELRKKD
jgi:CheY-like chemotaxis protein